MKQSKISYAAKIGSHKLMDFDLNAGKNRCDCGGYDDDHKPDCPRWKKITNYIHK